MSLLAGMLPALIGVAKDAFTKDNVKNSATTKLAGLLAVGGGAGLTMYTTKEEAVVSVVLSVLSVIMFFMRERQR